MESETTLAEFLRARLDEDERLSRAAIRTHEKAVADFKRGRPADMEDLPGETAADWDGGTNEDERGRFWCGVWAGEGIASIAVMNSEYDTDTAAHIARHDPARVLADVEAKRRIVDEIVPLVDRYDTQISNEWGGSEDETAEKLLRLLALPYAEHPDYREEWKP